MPSAAVNLVGFEGAIALAIAAGFRFSAPDLKDYALTPTRHLFTNQLPESGEIAEHLGGAALPYEPAREPAIALYGERGARAGSTSSRGGKLEVPVDFQLRIPRFQDAAKGLLQELFEYVEANFWGLVISNEGKKWQVKRALVTTWPFVFGRQLNDNVIVSGSIRFFAVSLD